MRICFMNTTSVWGGGEKWHLDHARAFREQGHEVFIIAQKQSDFLMKAEADGFTLKTVNIHNLSFLNPVKFFMLYRFFKRNSIDILVMNFSKDLKIGAPAARIAGVSSIVYRRGSAIPIKDRWLNRFLFGKCLTHILANSEATKRTVLENNPTLFPATKIKVIYNGIDCSVDTYKNTHPHKPVIIGNVGRLVYQKGQDLLIEMVDNLKSKGVECSVLIGGDGELRSAYQKTIDERGLNDMITLRGHVNNTPAFFEEIDIFVLPSRWEGFGYVLAEAMLAGKPIVAFNVSSNPELVENGVNGILVPWCETEAFEIALVELINNPDLRDKMGENGRKIVRDRFDFNKNKNQTIEYLTQTLSPPC
jgi:glycosyltransferase involved in cell wall biosynthesis